MDRKAHDAFPMGLDFLNHLQGALDACGTHTDDFAGSAGRALPETLVGLGNVLSLIYRLACCAWGCRGGDHQIEWLAGRIVNQATAAHRLIRAALYDEALVLIRGTGEIANLLWLFHEDKSQLESWQTAQPKMRLKEFGPSTVRKKLEVYGGWGPVITEERYKRLCEIGTHPIPGLTPGHYTGSGRPILGGVLQPVGVYMCTSELGYAVGIAAVPLIGLLNPEHEVKQLLFDSSIKLIRSLGRFNVLNYEELLTEILTKNGANLN